MTEIPDKYSVFEDLDRQQNEAKTNIHDASLTLTEGILMSAICTYCSVSRLMCCITSNQAFNLNQ